MKFEKPTEEMKKSLYKNYKWSVFFEIFLFGLCAILTTPMFILTILQWGKISIMYIIFTGVLAFIFIYSVVLSISTLRKMKNGDFMVSKVIFKATHKPLHSPLKMEIEYENGEGIMVRKSYQADIGKRGKALVSGEEIFITIMPDQVMYVVK